MKYPTTTVTYAQVAGSDLNNLKLNFIMPDGTDQEISFNHAQATELLSGLDVCCDGNSQEEFILLRVPASDLEKEEDDDADPVDAYCLFHGEYPEAGIMWEVPVVMESEVPEPEGFVLCGVAA